MSFRNLSTKPRIDRPAWMQIKISVKEGSPEIGSPEVGGEDEGMGSRVGADLLLDSYIFCKPCMGEPAPF